MPRLHPRTGALLPEVLSPVGAPDCLPAAVAGGADAVFLGLRHFNARGRAENFRKADLPAYVRYLHEHDIKCYVVMNTLVHDDEFPKALDLAGAAADAGVDAAIIQDLGLWRLLTREVPRLKRHASTQMTIHHPSQIAVLAALGAERVILARELTLAEVTACTVEARRHGIETEHFVHGALCYAFSGQCLMSNFAGCRSANRGTCAQNCRFDYKKLTPGLEAEATTEISMKDLALFGRIPELAKAGVSSLKIEGRLKGADYVYTTTRIYRAAVDAWANGTSLDVAWAKDLQRDVFSRANTDAPLAGIYDARSRLHRYAPEQDLVADATLYTLDRARGEAVLTCKEVRAGQGYAFTVDDFNGGFLVIAADRHGRDQWRCRIRIAPHGPKVPTGTKLFRNTDHARKQEAAAAMAVFPLPQSTGDTVGVALHVSAAVGAPLHVSAITTDGRQADATSPDLLSAATGKPLDVAQLQDKLGAFGGTAFHLTGIHTDLVGAVFCPASVMKELRRTLVEALMTQTPVPPVAVETWTPPETDQPRRRATGLWVAVSSLAAVEVAFAAGAERVILDDPALDLWGAVAPTIAHRDGLWLRHPATAPLSPHLAAIGLPIVAGHLGVIAAAHAAKLPVMADFFCNSFSTETLLALQDLGAQAAVISLECSSREVARLAARCGVLSAPQLALVASGRLPAMLTRQDHGLEAGASVAMQAVPKDGGLPYTIERRRHDTVIWEGRRLSCPEQVAVTAGLVDAWVLEYGGLNAEQITAGIQRYAALRDGTQTPADVAEADDDDAQHGLFTGHLHQGSRELDLVADKL
jgi:putative protease